MTEFVRVKDKETGHHYSVTRERYESAPDLWQELKQDAVDASGEPAPPKYHTEVSSPAQSKASGTTKE